MMEPGSDGYERMFSWLGDEARETWAKGMDFTNGVTPDYRGWFSAWLPNSAPHAEWTGMVVEAGTYGVIEVMDGIRRSEEHTSELQSLMRISYAVFCLKKKK